MASPSEAFKWKLFDAALKHICDACKRELRVQDVGEHRTYWDEKPPRTVFWCKEHRGGRL